MSIISREVRNRCTETSLPQKGYLRESNLCEVLGPPTTATTDYCFILKPKPSTLFIPNPKQNPISFSFTLYAQNCIRFEYQCTIYYIIVSYIAFKIYIYICIDLIKGEKSHQSKSYRHL